MSTLKPLLLFSVIALLSACSPNYLKIENARVIIKERTFTHEYDNGLSLSIVCREKAGTATVAAKIKNDTLKPITVRDHVALYIEGNQAFQRVNDAKSHTIEPGKSLELGCDYTFAYSFKRGEETIFPGQQLVFVKLDKYESPHIYLDLSADNHTPFRFATHP